MDRVVLHHNWRDLHSDLITGYLCYRFCVRHAAPFALRIRSSCAFFDRDRCFTRRHLYRYDLVIVLCNFRWLLLCLLRHLQLSLLPTGRQEAQNPADKKVQASEEKDTQRCRRQKTNVKSYG